MRSTYVSAAGLAMLATGALADRALLAMHGHCSWYWVPVYALGYGVLVAVQTRVMLCAERAIAAWVALSTQQNEVIGLQQKRIEQLEPFAALFDRRVESSSPGGTIPPGPSSA